MYRGTNRLRPVHCGMRRACFSGYGPRIPIRRLAALTATASGFLAAPLAAQTDFYNTDASRPVRVEDAYAIEHRGLEVQATPLRLERGKGGQYRWGIEPAIEYGVLPRTQLEVGFPVAWLDTDGARHRAGLAGIDLSVLHNLNVETRLPALALAANVLLPVGTLSASRAYPSLTGIATKTFSRARFHVNGQYTFGDVSKTVPNTVQSTVGAGVLELSRWLGGVAIDHTFPLRSTLITAEVYAQGALADAGDVSWNTTVGTRYQLAPRWAVDGGVGRRLTGPDQAWSITVGGAYAFSRTWRR